MAVSGFDDGADVDERHDEAKRPVMDLQESAREDAVVVHRRPHMLDLYIERPKHALRHAGELRHVIRARCGGHELIHHLVVLSEAFSGGLGHTY